MSRRQQTSTRPAGWAQIDARFKPSKARSTEALRPKLQYGVVTHEKDGSYLNVTDSYILVRLPISMDARSKKDREAELPAGPILPEALQALDRSRTGYFRVKNECVEVYGERVLYPLPTEVDGEFPDYRELVPNGDAPKDGIASLAVNPVLLRRTSEALGATGRGGGIKLRFYGPLRPIVVEPMGIDGVGVVMPIREAA